MGCRVLAAIAAIGIFAAPIASAQTSPDEFEKQIAERLSTFEAYERQLTSDDRMRRRVAMELLLKSDDPMLVARAREFGLFADDGTLRNAALRAVLDSAPRLRVVLKPRADDKENKVVFAWAAWDGGTDDGSIATVSEVIGPWDPNQKCWLDPASQYCMAALNGDTLSFWPTSTATSSIVLTLQADGVLRGVGWVARGGTSHADVTIDLDE